MSLTPRDLFGDPMALETHPTKRKPTLHDLCYVGQSAYVVIDTPGPHQAREVMLQAPLNDEFTGELSWSVLLGNAELIFPAHLLRLW